MQWCGTDPEFCGGPHPKQMPYPRRAVLARHRAGNDESPVTEGRLLFELVDTVQLRDRLIVTPLRLRPSVEIDTACVELP